MNTDEVTNIEKYRQGWKGGLPETPCGNGSTLKSTAEQRAWLSRVFDQYKVSKLVDIGAGDLNWISHMDLNGIDYKPFDLVPRMPGIEEFDIRTQVPPDCDMVMCLWVLNHLSFVDARRAWKNLRATNAKWLIVTHRPRWDQDTPSEIVNVQAHDAMFLNSKGDRLKLIRL